jgi:phage recombination protein Bet
MSKAVALVNNTDLTPEQVDLVKRTIANGASNDELKLFLYRCQEMGLDPLKPGQIHFVKYGNSPGTIVTGIDGFRSKAGKTGKHTGTKRGVIRDEKGKCVGAWCEVYRKDWEHPAREEVSLSEYNTGKGPWAKMPETMIKKVAEAAALRLAFPDDLGGLYSMDEMDQAEHGQEQPKDVSPKNEGPPKETKLKNYAPQSNPLKESDDPSEFVVPMGQYSGKKLKDIPEAELAFWADQLEKASKSGEKHSAMAKKILDKINEYINPKPLFDESEEFPH